MELGCVIMILQSNSEVCRLRKKSRMELACIIMTLKNKSKAFRLRRKSRMELVCALMVLLGQRKVCRLRKKSRVVANLRSLRTSLTALRQCKRCGLENT